MPILGLFKTKEERRQERTIQVRQLISQLKREIKSCQKNQTDYIEKARIARKKGFQDQYNVLKSNILRVMKKQTDLEHKILVIETAMQTQAEMESDKVFAESMNAISKSMIDLFNPQEMAKMQANFDKAAIQAEQIHTLAKDFVDSFTQDMSSLDIRPDEGIDDDELDRLILGADAASKPSSKSQDSLLDEIDAMEKELTKSR